jgi:hypothetical protein
VQVLRAGLQAAEEGHRQLFHCVRAQTVCLPHHRGHFTDHWSDNAENARDQQPPVSKITLHDLEASQIDWSRQPSAPVVLKPKTVLCPIRKMRSRPRWSVWPEADRGS